MRKALCVGIDKYPAGAELGGCVNDAQAWGAYLESRQFAVQMLTDADATRTGIIEAIRRLVSTADADDVLAIQYSGHGTQAPDLDGDEGDGWDEALVPVDYRTGALLIDDDLRAIFDQLPAGVTLTVFLDCCYSGTATRLLGINALRTAPYAGRRSRFLPLTGNDIAAHVAYRGECRQVPAFRAAPEDMNHATVSACLPQEVAWETNGMGDFTRAALGVLKRSGYNLTLNGLLSRVLADLGPDRWQTPCLDGPVHMLKRTLVRKTSA